MVVMWKLISIHHPSNGLRAARIKDKVYLQKSTTGDQLKAEIYRAYNKIPNEMIRQIYDSIASRYQEYLDQIGHQFEYLRLLNKFYICLL